MKQMCLGGHCNTAPKVRDHLCPSCERGSKVPHLVEKSNTTEAARGAAAASDLAASVEARWQINLSCRMRVCESIQGRGICPGYAPHKQPSLPDATKKTANKEVIIPEGACACQAKCATMACPCKVASRPCAPARCIKHDKTSYKCKHMYNSYHFATQLTES